MNRIDGMTDYDQQRHAKWERCYTKAHEFMSDLKKEINSDLHHIICTVEVEERLADHFYNTFDKWGSDE